MSVLLSISSILSFFTFLTTVVALVRVGTAAFASNQPFKSTHPQIDMQPLRIHWGSGEHGISLSRVMRMGLKAEREEKEKVNGGLENGYLGGAPLVRMTPMGMLSAPGRVLGRPRKSDAFLNKLNPLTFSSSYSDAVFSATTHIYG